MLSELPLDILRIISSHLDAYSFLNLTSTCKTLHVTDVIDDSLYWCNLTRTTFHSFNLPAIQNDGANWRRLYKNLCTQSRAYVWGDQTYRPALILRKGISSRIGSSSHTDPLADGPSPWPTKVNGIERLGVIVDVQCGLCCTTILTAKGALYTARRLKRVSESLPKPLRYPPGFPQPSEKYDSRTYIKQFSVGFSGILALSQSGVIWSWWEYEEAVALRIKFSRHETIEGNNRAGHGVVKRVLAGSSSSAALVEGLGIILWETVGRADRTGNFPDNRDASEVDYDNENALESDNDEVIESTVVVTNEVVVPGTGYKREGNGRLGAVTDESDSLGHIIGEVCDFVLLNHLLVFCTDIGKIFTVSLDRLSCPCGPVELDLSNFVATSDSEEVFVTGVQSSYRNVAIFTRSGAVLITREIRLIDLVTQRQRSPPRPFFDIIPALQHQDVVKIVFGRRHCHAIHASGHITSHGTSCTGVDVLGLGNSCALGLGGRSRAEGRLRGICFDEDHYKERLVPSALHVGRRIWFDQGRRAWIETLSAGKSIDGAIDQVRLLSGDPAEGEDVSDWIERQGRSWYSTQPIQQKHSDGPHEYFVLSVSTAGQDAVALVLENKYLGAKLETNSEDLVEVDPKLASYS